MIVSNESTLFIHDDNNQLMSEYRQQEIAANNSDCTVPPSIEPERHTVDTDESILDVHDEEFERNFLRAVDRALGVVDKDHDLSIVQLNNDASTTIDQSSLNLVQMTERALASLQNSTLFTVKTCQRYSKVGIQLLLLSE
jgi:hypothetical protein